MIEKDYLILLLKNLIDDIENNIVRIEEFNIRAETSVIEDFNGTEFIGKKRGKSSIYCNITATRED